MAMLTIRRRRSTSLRHCRLASARSSGSRRDPKQPLACPWFTLATKCKLRLLKLDRVKDYLLMEEDFVAGQERLKP
jgi:26S proteasome regulatory subunit T2